MGGKFHLKLNTCGRPIANKYREGKMKRTLKRELKVLEIAGIEGMATSIGRGNSFRGAAGVGRGSNCVTAFVRVDRPVDHGSCCLAPRSEWVCVWLNARGR